MFFLEQLDEEFGGQLGLARQIFADTYPKKFLHQLVSGQLDMDRLDYLSRDSFFTGVSEGVVGYDRIIQMLAVQDGELVVEEKGIYSVEKFLIARRLMYWQVYLHKTVLSAEQMLLKIFQRARALAASGAALEASEPLSFFLHNDVTVNDFGKNKLALLEKFAEIDDCDIIFFLKNCKNNKDILLPLLSEALLNRNLFKLILRKEPFESDYIKKLRLKAVEWFKIPYEISHYLVFDGLESNTLYNSKKEEIKISFKDGTVLPMSEATDQTLPQKKIDKYYICFPKNIL